jgi:DNA end-binding protein Ku
MAPRAIWSGALSFGLVNVPIKLYSATRSKDVRFNQLHAADGGRIRQKRVCSVDGSEVGLEEIVKGYELSPDRYVTITQSELDAIAPRASRLIEIEEFVDLAGIDPLFYESAYYLVPDKGAAKPYSLLLQAMEEEAKVAIGRVVLRSKEYLTAIRPLGDTLTMATMRFADEIVPRDQLEGLPGGDVVVAEREVAMARQLVQSLSSPFEPEKYRDTYRDQLLAMIEQKAEGQEIVLPAEEAPAPKAVDLMAALEASLAAAKARKAEPAEPAAKTRKAANAPRAPKAR